MGVSRNSALSPVRGVYVNNNWINSGAILYVVQVSVPALQLFPQGMPASWWNHLHNQHHAKPNCFRKDPDLNMHPLLFSLGKPLSIEVSMGRDVWRSKEPLG